ncbi:ABC transporter permease [Granulicella arctica]|uniref:Putative ABC transport system permease protein n=1 Tax=Granulicella arctica TaxID=940613 RepID=A0A7Y9THX3_9BACT|nr:FtsX-like permease family protein [Granulicella arctica]NYF80979.1 putative ABC transport system permease protein [Granulicella arctica]
MANNLSWMTAAKIAAREMRSSRGKFFFVVLSVAIGVAALTGVRGFSASFRGTLLTRARSIMAADLSARMFQQPTPEQKKGLEAIEAEGVLVTPVTEMLSMASSPKTMDPLLISLKAVDPAMYPFYGTVDLQPVVNLKDVLKPDTVVVADDLLVRLHMQIGDQLKIGGRVFRIAAVVTNEPDRLSGSFASGPRVLITRKGLDAAGLLAPGSHAGQRFLFKVPAPRNGDPISEKRVVELKERLERMLPEAQVTDYRETNPALTQGLDRATSLLSLMSLVSLVLGAIGVAMAMRAHLQQRLDTIAIMKSLGASSTQIIKIYLLQTLLLGLLGGLLGVGLGVGVQLAFPALLAKLINIDTVIHVQARTIFTGLAVGVLTTLLFTLPPLLDICGVRPILILRRAVEENDDPFVRAIFRKISKNFAQIAAAVLILGGLAVIATMLSDSAEVGQVFSVGLVAVLAVLLGASAGVLAVLRWFLTRTRLYLPSALRHGLANLYRPGNPSAALLAALGMGVMQIMTVYLVQQAVVTELHFSSTPNLPNVFLIDIANDEINGIKALLHAQPQVRPDLEMLPVVSSRILTIDGVPAAQLKLKNFPKRMLQSINLTWSDALQPGTTTTSGRWWAVGEQGAVVAVAERQAGRLGVKVGSQITFAAQDKQFTATVVALTKADGQHAYARAEFVLPPAALKGMPVVWYGGIHVDPQHVDEVQRALYAAYPSVTVINVAQALETVRAVVIQITYVIQFLSAFSIFAGVIILASSIAGTHYRRIREVVVLKTLGATRARIAAIFSIEFAVLGLVAGFVGTVFANVIAAVLLHNLTIVYRIAWMTGIVALLGTASLTVGTGWISSHRILGQKPLEVLREE